MSDTYKIGDRVYRYWDSGAMGAEIQPLTIVRVNRLSVTVRTDQDATFRMNPGDIVDFYSDEPGPQKSSPLSPQGVKQ